MRQEQLLGADDIATSLRTDIAFQLHMWGSLGGMRFPAKEHTRNPISQRTHFLACVLRSRFRFADLCALRATPKAVRLLQGREVPRNQDTNLNAYMRTTTSKDNPFPLLNSSCLRQTQFFLAPTIFWDTETLHSMTSFRPLKDQDRTCLRRHLYIQATTAHGP